MIEPDSHVVSNPERWSTHDSETTEDEVIRLIAALVDAIKPQICVEVGSYLGSTSQAIGETIKDYGRLYTFEAVPELAYRVVERCKGLPVEVFTGIDTDFDPYGIGLVDFLFVDGALHNRGESLKHWQPVLKPGALIAVHDSLKYPEVSAAIAPFRTNQHVDIVTPRGLTLMRNNGH